MLEENTLEETRDAAARSEEGRSRTRHPQPTIPPPPPPGGEHQCPGEAIVGAAGGCPDSVHGEVLVEARCQTGWPHRWQVGYQGSPINENGHPGSSGSGMDGTADMGSSASTTSTGAPGSGKEMGGYSFRTAWDDHSYSLGGCLSRWGGGGGSGWMLGTERGKGGLDGVIDRYKKIGVRRRGWNEGEV